MESWHYIWFFTIQKLSFDIFRLIFLWLLKVRALIKSENLAFFNLKKACLVKSIMVSGMQELYFIYSTQKTSNLVNLHLILPFITFGVKQILYIHQNGWLNVINFTIKTRMKIYFFAEFLLMCSAFNNYIYWLTFLVSNTHELDPSGSTLFHHLKPTNNRPVTFLTTQKSNANNNITKMNNSTKLLLNIYEPNTYNKMANVLNNTWNNTAMGCLQTHRIWSQSCMTRCTGWR